MVGHNFVMGWRWFEQCIDIPHRLYLPGTTVFLICLYDSVLLDEIEGNAPITAKKGRILTLRVSA